MATNISVLSNRVAPDVIGCPSGIVDNAVIDAIIKFYEETYIVEQGFSHDVVEADIDAADNNAVSVDIVTDGGVSADLRPVVITEFRIDGSLFSTEYSDLLNDLDDDDFNARTRTDKIVFTYPDLTTIKFLGIEARDQRFFIQQAYTPLTTITTLDDIIYQRFHIAIEARARWELMIRPGKDWSNAPLAAYNMSIYKTGVAEAKTLKSHGYTKSNQRVKSQRFF